jgi:acyl-CoA synthetase (AMP-forming)/AMP-acid ligase II
VSMAPRSGTLVDLLRERAESNDNGFTFLPEGEGAAVHLSYAELDGRSRGVAAELAGSMAARSRAVLVYPPGLEFLSAFFGCLYAGVVAVPTHPPSGPAMDAWITSFERLVADADPDAILTTSEFLELKQASGIRLGPERMRWVATDTVPSGAGERWRGPRVSPDDAAFIQYTSGSTSRPKGVVLRHRSLLENQRPVAARFGLTPDSVVVSWLPVYHDMGLIGCVMQPLYQGCRACLLSPLHFLQRPARWLEAITRFRGTCSGGPNFAYELCAKRVTEQERESLDLSSWTTAFTGAESVRARTLERFATAFTVSGFSRSAFLPCYGLAEATLFVSGTRWPDGPRPLALDRHRLEAGRATSPEDGMPGPALVSNGPAAPGTRVVIADPATGAEREPGSVGEIWVQGPSVAAGYWRQRGLTAETFHSALASGERPFLRTGDLGFLWEGELYVTGRIKELVLIRGRNVYPEDVEEAAQGADARLRAGCGAAFALDGADGEELALVQETTETAPPELDVLIGAVRRRVADSLQLALGAIVLVPPRAVPKTSSGKLRRLACREALRVGELQVLAESRRGSAQPVGE